jgi:YD repeat-containing protein
MNTWTTSKVVQDFVRTPAWSKFSARQHLFDNKVNVAMAYTQLGGQDPGEAAALIAATTASNSATVIGSAIAGTVSSTQTTLEQEVAQVYVYVLNRAPTAGELAAGVALLQQHSGGGGFDGIAALAQSLFDGAYGQALYQGNPTTMALDTARYATDGVMDSSLQSQIEANAPAASAVGTYVAVAIGGLENPPLGSVSTNTDSLLFNNRVAAALAYAALGGQNDGTAAQAVLGQVSTADTANAVDAAFAAIAAQNAQGMQLTVSATASGPTSATPTEYLQEDRWGNLTGSTDPRRTSYQTHSTYNQNNQVLATTTADGSTVTDNYDSDGRLVAATDGRGNTSRTVYDMNGNVGHAVDADGGIVDYGYDSFGERITASQSIQAGGAVTTSVYNQDGELVDTVSSPVVVTVTAGQSFATPQPFAWIVSSNAQQVVTNYRYDELGRRIAETVGTVAVGTPVSASSAPPFTSTASVTATQYDMAGNVTASIEGVTAKATATTAATTATVLLTQYDAFSRKIGQTDGNGNTQSWQYNSVGQMVASTDMSGDVTTYSYDHAGHVTYQSTAAAPVQYEGNGFSVISNANLSASDDLGNALAPSSSTSYTYEGNLLVQQILSDQTSATGTTVGTTRQTETTDYSYDLAGNQIAEVETLSTAGSSTGQPSQVVQYTHTAYDAMNRVVKIEDSRYDVSYTYDANGNRVEDDTQYVADTPNGETDDGSASSGFNENSRLVAQVADLDNGAVGGDGATNVDDVNAFDAMNRETVVDGVKTETATGAVAGIDATQGHEPRAAWPGPMRRPPSKREPMPGARRPWSRPARLPGPPGRWPGKSRAMLWAWKTGSA